ncbi:MAG: Wzt carbohydrate-binding domain-containing protein [Bryobacterales bacterium]|nr:Wzt carbohydrate-binding domain-containing protein [Bryobacterales bacterium]
MSIIFEGCACSPLFPFTAAAPSGFVIGVVGDDGAGKQTLLRLASGTIPPEAGSVAAAEPHRHHGPFDALVIDKAQTLSLYHTLALKDAAGRAQAAIDLELFRRRGGTALLVSHELDLIQWLADEVWWLQEGRLAAKGDPREVLDLYRHHLAARLRARAAGAQIPLTPTMRRGDGRATILSIETLDEQGAPTAVWLAGQTAGIRVTVRFHQYVEDPVIGILIRTRIGFEVFGTNTELEKATIGPRRAGQTLQVTFSFACHLCPHEYTLTAASHDPDGVWHDWVEDGIAFTVSDSRYTAGVACLRASVDCVEIEAPPGSAPVASD